MVRVVIVSDGTILVLSRPDCRPLNFHIIEYLNDWNTYEVSGIDGHHGRVRKVDPDFRRLFCGGGASSARVGTHNLMIEQVWILSWRETAQYASCACFAGVPLRTQETQENSSSVGNPGTDFMAWIVGV